MLVNTGKDLPITEVTKDNYAVPAGEEQVFHARIEVKKFDSNSGERQSIPRIQKFGPKSFKTVLSNLKKQGFAVDILHDPSEFLSVKKKEQEENAAERIKKAKEAEEARLAAEKEALKAELRAELLAELKQTTKKEEAKEDAKPAVGTLPSKK